jgi:hypothetical protein
MVAARSSTNSTEKLTGGGPNKMGAAIAPRDLEKTEREIGRLIEAIKAGVTGAAVKDEITVLEARRAELLART